MRAGGLPPYKWWLLFASGGGAHSEKAGPPANDSGPGGAPNLNGSEKWIPCPGPGGFPKMGLSKLREVNSRGSDVTNRAEVGRSDVH